MILYFLKKHFNDPDGLVTPIDPANINLNTEEMKKIFRAWGWRRYKENYKILSREVRNLNENIPPLINAYMNLSPTMRTFGTFINHKFGDVEETGIMITLRDIYVEKINRHLASYKKGFRNHLVFTRESIGTDISSFHVVNKRLVYNFIAAWSRIITCKVPVTQMSGTSFMKAFNCLKNNSDF